MLVIETNRGERYLVNERNEIIRTDIPFEPSGQWHFIGLEARNRPSEFIRVDTIRDHLRNKGPLSPMRYKNGNPIWTVRDNDHGTFRSWGGMAGRNTPYGVERVYLQN